MLGKLWGQCHRARVFFNAFKDEYLVKGSFAKSENVSLNGVGASLTNVFGELDGFNRIVRTLRGNGDRKIPLDISGTILS